MGRKRLSWAFPYLLLAAVLCVLFGEALFLGKGVMPVDGIRLFPPWRDVPPAAPSNYLLVDQFLAFLPLRHFQHAQLWEGRLPLWNPLSACGVPFTAAIQTAALYPLNLLLAPLDPVRASAVAAFLKLLLAGAFMMLYMGALRAGRGAALLSGLVFSLSGFMVVWLGHPHVNCALWLPLLLYAVEGGLEDPRRWALFAAGYACMVLGGHPPTVIHITLGVAAYACVRAAMRRGRAEAERAPGRAILLLAAAVAAGLLLAAPQVLPYLEYVREGSTTEIAASLRRGVDHLSPKGLIHFLLPYLSGSPAAGYERLGPVFGLDAGDNFNERTGYVGVVPLLLAMAALFLRRRRVVRVHAAAVLLCLCVVYGLPPLSALLGMVPILQWMSHTRLLLFVCFSLAVMAGFGLEALDKAEAAPRLKKMAAGTAVAAAVCLAAGWIVFRSVGAGLDGSERAFLLIQGFMFLAGLAAAAGSAAWAGAGRRGARVLCLLWTACDLLWFAYGYNPTAERAEYYPEPASVGFVKRDPGVFRIFGLGDILPPNTAAVHGLQDVRGMDFSTVRRYEELITGRAGELYFFSASTALPANLRLLNVKYVLAPKAWAPPAEGFELVFEGKVDVYRYGAASQRAFVVFEHEVVLERTALLARARAEGFDPSAVVLLEEEPERPPDRGRDAVPAAQAFPEGVRHGAPAGVDAFPGSAAAAVRIVDYRPGEVLLEAYAPRPGFLVLLDTYFPGWKAAVNGKPARIHRADYAFRAVVLPAGTSSIRFRYRPASFWIGLALALAAALAVAAVFLKGSRSAGRSGSGGGGRSGPARIRPGR
ncbi:MAG: YfhO family protein [Elusimicrobiota bacterium]